MRRPRRLAPEARWFVTVRCARSEFRLVPTEERAELFAFVLARALARCDEVALHAVVQMSNHFHLVVTDGASQLSTFMAYLNGQLAKALNRADRTTGQVFERRFSAIEIIDDAAVEDRMIYTVTNPVAAGLVRTHGVWPGLVAWAGKMSVRLPCRRFEARAYRYAVAGARRRRAPVDREAFTERATLVLTPAAGADRTSVARGIANREREIRRERGGRFLGARAVVAFDPFDRPTTTKRTPMPLVHASTLEGWLDYRRHWRRFVAAYHAASTRFRRGHLMTRFPDHTFRPSLATHPHQYIQKKPWVVPERGGGGR